MRRYFSSALLGSVAVAAVAVLIVCPLCPVTSATELALLDGSLRCRSPGKPRDVVLVSLSPGRSGDGTIVPDYERRPDNCRCPEGQPFRLVYADLLRELGQRKVRVVVLDVMFRNACPAHDPALAKAIREARAQGTTVIVAAYATENEPPAPPLSPLREAIGEKWIGSPWLYAGEYGGAVHSVDLVQRFEARGCWYPLCLLAAQAALFPKEKNLCLTPTGSRANFGPDDRKITIPIRRGDRLSLSDDLRCDVASATLPALMLINWAGPEGTFPHLDYRVPGGVIAEDETTLHQARVVFIGSPQDRQRTPLGDMPGMEIHANATHTLLAQRFLRPVGTPAMLLLMGVLALLTTFVVRRSPPAQALLATAGLTALVLLLAHLALRVDRWLYATLPILALGLSFGLTALLEQRAVRTLLPPWLWGRALVTEEGTALVTDVRSSVGIGVLIGSEWKFRALNAYFAQAEKIIADHGGDLVDYAGDASVFWFRRAKSEEASHAQRALSAARKLVENLKQFQVEWPAESRELFDFGIGIDTGQATIGLAGGRLRKQPSIVGTCVDVAARLESMTKEYHCRLLVSENTYRHAPDVLAGEPLGALPVRGLPEPLQVYRVWPRDEAAKVATWRVTSDE